MKSANYESHSKKSALPLNNKRKKVRLAFAKKCKDWTVADWRRVVFSDETKVNRVALMVNNGNGFKKVHLFVIIMSTKLIKMAEVACFYGAVLQARALVTSL